MNIAFAQFNKVVLLCLLFLIVIGHSYIASAQTAVEKSASPKLLTADRTELLDIQLDEISGLALVDHHYWGVNDSGNSAQLYAFSKEGLKLTKSVKVNNASNFDWEELAQDSQNVYIADTGDNFALRRTIDIYKIAKSALNKVLTNTNKAQQSVPSTLLKLQYNTKHNLLPSRQHDFDAEAMTSVGDKLWLFSKNRTDQRSQLYVFDKNNKKQTINSEYSYPVEGKITAADYNEANHTLILLGYSTKRPYVGAFVWVLNVVDDLPDWSSATKYRILPYGQWESVQWLSDKRFVLAAEKGRYSEQMVGYFHLP